MPIITRYCLHRKFGPPSEGDDYLHTSRLAWNIDEYIENYFPSLAHRRVRSIGDIKIVTGAMSSEYEKKLFEVVIVFWD